MNLKKLFRVFNPSATLDVSDPEDRKYYIDFSSVRSGNLIKELKRTITLSEVPTCQLFTGHIGCGKSTELQRLKAELEEQNFHVVYFESSEELDMGDIDITDILLLTVRKIAESLEKIGIAVKPTYFSRLFGEIKDLLLSEIDLSAGMDFKLGLAKITAKTKESPKSRTKLRDYLEGRTDNITASINEEVLEPAAQRLKEMGKQGLVVIVDNLDRMDNTPKPSGRTQPEYIFADRGEQLKKLNCHLLYTIPLTLIFSNEANTINSRFGVRPKNLSMVPVQSRDGCSYEQGLALLRQMVMVRIFPDLSPDERLEKIEVLFESQDMLDRLCKISGGHVRNLLGFLFSCLQKEDPPFPQEILDEVIQEYQDDLVKKITPDEWELLRQVDKNQSVAGEEEYDILLRGRFVFEYQDKQGVWFGVNPLLAEMDKLRSEP
ncbi:P-loop NTPase fold protein [Desulfococcaceae bacterium HSG9]|nr:P-loop NTPase fold protein [Desulfococcaceae bacterium HSG9]